VTGPRVYGKLWTRPRVFDKVADSVEAKLRDQVWLRRDEATASSEDGTPVTNPVELGPYAGQLSTPETSEVRETDRYLSETTHLLQLSCDEEIRPYDRFRIRRRRAPSDEFFRITRVRELIPDWDGRFLHVIELAKTDEY
jgi:hypothetical protein